MIAASRYLFIHDARADSATLRESLIRQWKDIDRGVEYDFYAAGSPEDARDPFPAGERCPQVKITGLFFNINFQRHVASRVSLFLPAG